MNIINDLKYERSEIDKIMKQNEYINSAFMDSQLIVERNYYNYIVFFFVALLLIMLVLRFGIFGTEGIQSGGWFKKVQIKRT